MSASAISLFAFKFLSLWDSINISLLVLLWYFCCVSFCVKSICLCLSAYLFVCLSVCLRLYLHLYVCAWWCVVIEEGSQWMQPNAHTQVRQWTVLTCMSGIRCSSAVVHAEQSTATCLLHQALRPISGIYYCCGWSRDTETQGTRETRVHSLWLWHQPMVIHIRRFCRLTTVGQCFFSSSVLSFLRSNVSHAFRCLFFIWDFSSVASHGSLSPKLCRPLGGKKHP